MVTSFRQHPTEVDDLAWLIRMEFEEMPGMRLTFPQVRRLWSLSIEDARKALDYLVASGFLVQDDERRYGRTMDHGEA